MESTTSNNNTKKLRNIQLFYRIVVFFFGVLCFYEKRFLFLRFCVFLELLYAIDKKNGCLDKAHIIQTSWRGNLDIDSCPAKG